MHHVAPKNPWAHTNENGNAVNQVYTCTALALLGNKVREGIFRARNSDRTRLVSGLKKEIEANCSKL